MTVSLKHQFVSNVADSPDATLVQPSNWNAEHTLTANADSLLGAVTAGNVVEVTCTSAGRALLDDADASAQRTTLGLGTISTQNSNNVSITGGSVTGITDLAVADGGTGASDAATARTNLGVGTLGTQNSNAVSITGGTIVANASGISIRDADASNVMTIAVGSNLTANTTLTLTTGASSNRTLDISATNVTVSVAGAALIDDADASAQRTTLGLGTIATQNANNVSITGGSITGITDLAVADGGTGASDAATARTNLGIGTLGTQNSNAVAITGGTIVANASGISIRDADASNVMTIAVGSNLTANTTLTLTTGATTNRTLDISATNVTVSVAGAALIDDADTSAQRTTLGLGTISTQNANNVSITGGSITGITDLAIADGGTGASTAAAAATNLGLGTTDSPQFLAVNIGNATDTTVTRVSAGVIAVEGKTVVTETGGQTVQFAAGSNTAPSITTTGDTNTGIFFPAADSVSLTTGGSERFRFGSSGQIGIGGATYGTSGQALISGGSNAAPSWTNIVGQQTIWVPAVAMVTRTTNGATFGTLETTTNKVMLNTLDFDTSTQEFVQFAIQMPKSWNEGTLICQFIWSHPATTTNFGVAWQIQSVGLANDDPADTAFGTAVTVVDTGGTTNDIYITDETPAMTVAGTPTAEEYVIFQVARAVSNASDTMAVDARLHGVKIHYTTDAATDD